ncbi:hypothetical protein PoB_002869900 [Plakobranchus ocellatus]|uniref:Uncharacterized protein n=1 Tax=Plakobranchus ocellatus TaxID=259542 RepID=A0AAV4A3E3_9GAST|nr:hypothetical protein PoB_002869900 [Plakobranchus ocellatus]
MISPLDSSFYTPGRAKIKAATKPPPPLSLEVRPEERGLSDGEMTLSTCTPGTEHSYQSVIAQLWSRRVKDYCVCLHFRVQVMGQIVMLILG